MQEVVIAVLTAVVLALGTWLGAMLRERRESRAPTRLLGEIREADDAAARARVYAAREGVEEGDRRRWLSQVAMLEHAGMYRTAQYVDRVAPRASLAPSVGVMVGGVLLTGAAVYGFVAGGDVDQVSWVAYASTAAVGWLVTVLGWLAYGRASRRIAAYRSLGLANGALEAAGGVE